MFAVLKESVNITSWCVITGKCWSLMKYDIPYNKTLQVWQLSDIRKYFYYSSLIDMVLSKI